jgi:hypothetical protein
VISAGNQHTIFIDACPVCNGDGGFESTPHGYNPVTGEPITYWQNCRTCAGSGEVETEYECRTLEELEEEDAERRRAPPQKETTL